MNRLHLLRVEGVFSSPLAVIEMYHSFHHAGNQWELHSPELVLIP